MKIKLITFLVLATVAQCFCDQSSVAYFANLSDADSADLLKMKNYYNVTVMNEREFYGTLFDHLEKRVALLIYNATIANDDETSDIENAVTVGKEAIAYSISAAALSVGETTCDAATKNQDVAYSNVDDGFKIINEAIALAEVSNGSETTSEIEQYRTQFHGIWRVVLEMVFASASGCRSDSSAEVSEVIELGYRPTNDSLYLVVNAVFNAIQVYAAAVAEGSTDVSVLDQIQGYRSSALSSVASELCAKFATLEALLIYYRQKTNLSVADWYSVLTSNVVSQDKYAEAASTLFGQISDSANNIILGLPPVHSDDFSAEQIAVEETIAKWNVGTYQILQATFLNDSGAVETTGEKLSTINRDAVFLFFKQLKIAGTEVPDVSVAVAEIRNLTSEVENTVVSNYTQVFFDELINELNLTENVIDELTTLKTAANAQLKVIADGIANANVYLAEAASGNQTDNLLININAEKATVIDAVRNVSAILSSSKVVILLSDSVTSTEN